MIRLKHILAEISLAGVEPYTTHFLWRGRTRGEERYRDGDDFVCEIECNGHPILMNMMYADGTPIAWTHQSEGNWEFSFFVRARSNDGWTTQQDRGGAKGDINTLRLFKTIGLAIRRFVDTFPNIDIINIDGSDFTEVKSAQKSRVYAGLIASNPELSDFRVMTFGKYNGLYMVRRNLDAPRADASGIDTPGDPNM